MKKKFSGFTRLVEDSDAQDFSPGFVPESFFAMFSKKGDVSCLRKKTSLSFTTGFTVIELLVVIAIIGILASIIIAFLSSQNAKANDKKIMQQLSSMRSQANLYTGNNAVVSGTAPLTGLEDNLFGNTAAGIDSLYPLIKGLPTGTHYVYGSDGNAPSVSGQWYFAAMLSDGQSDCVDWSGASNIGTHTFITTTPPTGVGDWAGVVNMGTYLCL